MHKALALALFVAACGGGSDNSDHAAPDATKTNPGGDGGSTPTCTVSSTVSYTATSGAVADQDANPPTKYLAFDDNLNADAKPDIFEVLLTPGSGAFSGGLKTGTFPLTGDETNWFSCGACVTIYGDSPDPSSFQFTQLYQASSGSVTVTSISGTLSGSVKDVVLKAVAVDQDAGTQTDDGSGCTATIANATFSASITTDPPFTGKSAIRAKLHVGRN